MQSEEPQPIDQCVEDERDCILFECAPTDKHVDREEYREFDSYTGREIKAMYENRWFSGIIKYFKKFLKKHLVVHNDDSDDYVSPNNIDGIEVQFL